MVFPIYIWFMFAAALVISAIGFNLNGQEVPRLKGGGMNCPSAVRLTFFLT